MIQGGAPNAMFVGEHNHHEYYSYLNAINHSDMGVRCTNLSNYGAPPCTQVCTILLYQRYWYNVWKYVWHMRIEWEYGGNRMGIGWFLDDCNIYIYIHIYIYIPFGNLR